MLVAGDVYRPAAIDQLAILGKQVPQLKFLKVDYFFFFLLFFIFVLISEVKTFVIDF